MTSLKTQMAEHPPANPMNRVTQQELHDIIYPYIIRPEKGYDIGASIEEDETKFGIIFIDQGQPGPITHPPGAALNLTEELTEKLTNLYGYPVRFENGTRHWTRLGVFKY